MANAKTERLIDLRTLRRDLDRAFRNVAKEVGNDIQQEYVKQIMDFYGDYRPKSYGRTYALFEASSGYGGKSPLFGRNKYMSYWGGIHVDPSYITGDPYLKPYLHGWNTGDKGSPDQNYRKTRGEDAEIETDNELKKGLKEQRAIRKKLRYKSPHWRVPTAEIFERSFTKGIHGFAKPYAIRSQFIRVKNGERGIERILRKPEEVEAPGKMLVPPERSMRKYWKKIGKEVGERIAVELARINL